jgi:AraC-like DNA-binding protein
MIFFTIFAKKMSETKVINEITPLSDEDCFYIADRRKTKFTYPIHHHLEYELNFCERATGVKRTVGDSSEVIGDYDLVLITGSDLEHVWEQHQCTSQDVREITIQFAQDLFFKSFIVKTQFDSIRNMLEKAQNGLSFPLSAIMKIYPLIDSLSSEIGFYAVVKFLTILYELSLFLDTAKVLSSSSFAKLAPFSDSRRVQKVENYINSNYKQEIRLNHLAEIAGMTPVAFSRFFKLRTGMTLMNYIIEIRLGYAARMLVDSTTSIQEICYGCGFNNLSNFNRIFKKKKSCSPKEFRNKYRKQKKLV